MENHKPRKKRRYDAEFKKNALQLIADGRSVSSVAQSLGVRENLLYVWKSRAEKQGKEKTSNDSSEVARLKKELARVKIERDILKKALSIFSRDT